jgi:hypothetical protein
MMGDTSGSSWSKSRDRQAPQVAHHEQRVRIHRVGVEQVVLHAADDAAEGRDVAAEHAVVVHAPQLVGDAARRAQDLQEQAVIARVLAELLIDQPQVAPTARMVPARTPRSSGSAAAARTAPAAPRAVRANRSSLTASSEPSRTWKLRIQRLRRRVGI